MSRILVLEDIPRWHHLVWDDKTEQLHLEIHKAMLSCLSHSNMQAWFWRVPESETILPLFEKVEPALGKETFGINRALTLVRSEGDWLIYAIKIPIVKNRTGMTCQHCGGTGKKTYEGWENEDCDWCDADGCEYSHDNFELRQVTATLSILFCLLHYSDISVESDRWQLFSLESRAEDGMHGHSVGGYSSPIFAKWIEGFSDDAKKFVQLGDVENTMRLVHAKMFGTTRHPERFTAWIRRGQFMLDCPGNACEIHVDPDLRYGSGEGNRIVCHNLDGACQQIVLLAGMGGLALRYDKANIAKAV